MAACCTFGSPKVGNEEFGDAIKLAGEFKSGFKDHAIDQYREKLAAFAAKRLGER